METGTLKTNLPDSYWIENGRLAAQIMTLINNGSSAESRWLIQNIKQTAMEHKQEFMGEPTFAKTVIQLIEKIKAEPPAMLSMIADMARVTLKLLDLKTEQVN